MKRLPEVNEDFSKLYQILLAPIRTKLMMTGLELKIFNELSEFISADRVAQAIGSHAENTRRFLDSLAMIDLVEKKNGLYRNLPATQIFLRECALAYLEPLFLATQRGSIDFLDNLNDLIRQGPSPISPEAADMADESFWAVAAEAGVGWAVGGVSQIITKIIRQLPEFPSFKKMLDLGGGPGIFGIAIVSEHPSMKGIIFDQPAVVKVAEKYIREYELEDRMETMAGDYMKDSIGQNYDLIWASATLNFVRHDIDAMIKKIYDAIRPGGVFISFADGMTHERTRPDTMLGHIGSGMKTGTDFGFEQGEIADAMIRAGFRSVRSRTLKTPVGDMDMDIARKG
ncbi:methyltransferase [Desulfonema magnum]|uniref:SAM-dependent methyltransferase n=1 Tax=Desulfonema magnum TaxID=45655 RepID=A0A975BKD0_9BACT|nr:methyltransferase [Desulfonema magnum]QTA87006.1 SAM-dependent methyltransferase [Desulfonema magnum]